MDSKSLIAFIVAAALTAINLAGLAYAVVMGEVPHAIAHGVLSLLCGSWAYRRRVRAPGDTRASERIASLEDEVDQLRGELIEAQERLEFAERIMVSQVERPVMRHDP